MLNCVTGTDVWGIDKMILVLCIVTNLSSICHLHKPGRIAALDDPQLPPAAAAALRRWPMI